MLLEQFSVNSPNVEKGEDFIASKYTYQSTEVSQDASGAWSITPKETQFEFRTDTRVPKLG